MKRASIIYGLLLGLLYGFANEAIAQANFGLYEKLYYDGEYTHYQLVWSNYDSAIYNEPLQPGDFVLYVDCGDDGLPSLPGICAPGVNALPPGDSTLSDDGIRDRITIRGQRPRKIWAWSSSGGSGYPSRGRNGGIPGPMCSAMSARLGTWIPIGKTAIQQNDFLTLAQIGVNLQNATWAGALADIQRFRDTDGLHIIHAPGSVIPWQNAQIDWNEYGAADDNLTPEEVLQNFFDEVFDSNDSGGGSGGSC